ncbi:hypothetical protein ABZ682_19065 [Streptomyces griseoviridis]|uniref:hypothetical protein n=1 Tax=Streptomyces griseoviridis TaxID=45398 RepID=UPI0033C65D35
MSDGITIRDFAELARPAWGLYAEAAGSGRVSELISDLMHLSDVLGEDGGGMGAVRTAVGDYLQELEQRSPSATPALLGQFCPRGQDWITIVEGEESVDRQDVANCLRVQMQAADMHTDELPGHVEDLARGVVLVADNGTAFRVIPNPEYRG